MESKVASSGVRYSRARTGVNTSRSRQSRFFQTRPGGVCFGAQFPRAVAAISTARLRGEVLLRDRMVVEQRMKNKSRCGPRNRPPPAAPSVPCSCLLRLRQPGLGQPEIIDALYQVFERVQLHRLGEVTVRVELIAFHNIYLRVGSGQDDGGDQFQTVIFLDMSQNLAAIHFGGGSDPAG